ncbi:hypothetical protein WDW37_03975 [Bdellovibrionota bacterium FG-1]
MRQFRAVFIFWIILTVLIQPWRNSLSQDDAVYAVQALSFAQGSFHFHPDPMAAALPQSVLGGLAIRAFPFFKPLVVLNSLTWLLNLAVMCVLQAATGASALLICGLFSIPFWTQYSASFLYDLYAVLLLSLLLWTLQKQARLATIAVACLSFLLFLQLQSLLVVSLLLSAAYFYSKKYRQGLALLLGVIIGVEVFSSIPHGLYQQAAPYFLFHPSRSWKVMAYCFLQLLVGLGFFLLPATQGFSQWPVRLGILVGALQLAFIGFLLFVQAPVLAAGVFFSDYLPKILALSITSLGVLGWAGAVSLRPTRWSPQQIALAAAALIIVVLNAYRGANDIRYMMLLVPLILIIFREKLSQRPLATSNRIIFALSFFLSIVLNRYSLDTTEARWHLAALLESQGTPQKQISAGYGRDLFMFEEECTMAAYQKIGRPPLDSPVFFERVFSKIPRVYADEWIPQFVIKPYIAFGKTLALKVNRAQGQEGTASVVYPYSSLGVKHALAAFENKDFRNAWCFR